MCSNKTSDASTQQADKELPESATWGWYAIASSSDVTSARTSPVQIGSACLVAYRGESGRPYVVDGNCPRRGCPLSVGEVAGESIRCALDGWTWSPDGAATDATGKVHSDRILGLRYYDAHDVGDLVVVHVGSEAAQLDLALLDGVGESTGPVPLAVHEFVLVENVFDPTTLRYLLQAGSIGQVEVVSESSGQLHLRYSADAAGGEHVVDVRALGPGIMAVSDETGAGVVIAATPSGSGDVEFRSCSLGRASVDGGSAFDWGAFVDRQVAVSTAIEYTDGVCLSPSEQLARNTVRGWLRAAGGNAGAS